MDSGLIRFGSGLNTAIETRTLCQNRHGEQISHLYNRTLAISKGCVSLSQSLDGSVPAKVRGYIAPRERIITMAYWLPDEILQLATKCPHAREGTRPLPCQENPAMCCQVLGGEGDMFAFVDGGPVWRCTNFFHYGRGGCCSCPARIGLWNQHHV